MATWGEVAYDGGLDEYVGQDDDWRVTVTLEAWGAACHIMTMRGLDRRSWMAQLHDVTTWCTDATLHSLDGVAIARRTVGENDA